MPGFQRTARVFLRALQRRHMEVQEAARHAAEGFLASDAPMARAAGKLFQDVVHTARYNTREGVQTTLHSLA